MILFSIIAGTKNEKTNSDEDAWFEISSCRFKNIVFKKDGELEKYILRYIYSHPDHEELERLISIYRGIFINTNSEKQKDVLKRNVEKFFIIQN